MNRPDSSDADAVVVEGSARVGGGYTSIALRDIPIPDYCDVVIVPTRGLRDVSPEDWARAIFSHDNATLASRGVKALRDEAIRIFDLVPPPEKDREIAEVVGSEALVIDDSPGYAMRIGVAVEPGGDLLRITTAVKYTSVVGRVTFHPRRLMHASAVHTLARRAPVTLRRQVARTLNSPSRSFLGVSRLPKTQYLEPPRDRREH